MGIIEDTIKKENESKMFGKGSFEKPKIITKDEIKSSENVYQKNVSNDTDLINKDLENRKNMFIPEEPIRSFDDLIINEKTKSQILVALDKIQNHDLLYETWGLKQIDPDS